jgi:hypothetical protein
MQNRKGGVAYPPHRMKQTGAVAGPGRVRARWVLVAALAAVTASVGGGAGCSLLLDASANPYKCQIDSDCAHLPNAVCDSVKKECVPRLPNVVTDAGTDMMGGTCQVSFDNSRVILDGPDGGLRPLPEAP